MRALLRKPGRTVSRNYARLRIKITLTLAWGQKRQLPGFLISIRYIGGGSTFAALRISIQIIDFGILLYKQAFASLFITSRRPRSHQDDRDMFIPKQLLSLAVFPAFATFISALSEYPLSPMPWPSDCTRIGTFYPGDSCIDISKRYSVSTYAACPLRDVANDPF